MLRSDFPNPDEYNLQQKRYFERTTKRTMVPTDSRYLQRHVDQALSAAQLVPGERVLEVGCGMGRYTLLLAKRRVRVEGLDLSPVLLQRLQAFSGGRFDIPLHCADIDQPPPELVSAFDLVLGFFTLHHLYDLGHSFVAMTRLLKPGGRMVFVEPNPLNPLYYFQILITPGMTWQAERGLTRMRPDVICRAMQNAGLHLSTVARFGFFPPFVANQTWGCRLEAILEGVPIWQRFLPFQLFYGKRN